MFDKKSWFAVSDLINLIHPNCVLCQVVVRTLCMPVKSFHTQLTYPSLYRPCFVCRSAVMLEQEALSIVLGDVRLGSSHRNPFI